MVHSVNIFLGILNLWLFGLVYVNLPTYDQHYFQDSRLHVLKSLPPDPISYRSVQLLTWSGTKFWREKIWVIICSLKLSIKQKQFANLSRGMQTESYYNANKLTSHSTFMYEYSHHLFYVNHPQICSLNQPVLSKKGKVSRSKKQCEPLMVVQIELDRHTSISTAPCGPSNYKQEGLL